MATTSAPSLIRPGELADLELLARTHARTFGTEENLAARLGPGYLRSVYRWFLTSPETFVLIADVDGELGGWTALCDRPYNLAMLRGTWAAFVGGALAHPWALNHAEFRHRLACLLRRTPTAGSSADDPTRLAFLAYIATVPAHRGRGLGVGLLEAAKEACRARGATHLRSGIFRANDASLKMFQKAGFVLLERPRTPTHNYVQATLG